MIVQVSSGEAMKIESLEIFHYITWCTILAKKICAQPKPTPLLPSQKC